MMKSTNYAKTETAFAERLEWFVRQYAPRDRHDERDFTRDLYMLLDYARRIAQEPLVDKMSAAMALAPMQSIFVATNPGEPLK